jgi:hypothetical protein
MVMRDGVAFFGNGFGDGVVRLSVCTSTLPAGAVDLDFGAPGPRLDGLR